MVRESDWEGKESGKELGRIDHRCLKENCPGPQRSYADSRPPHQASGSTGDQVAVCHTCRSLLICYGTRGGSASSGMWATQRAPLASGNTGIRTLCAKGICEVDETGADYTE